MVPLRAVRAGKDLVAKIESVLGSLDFETRDTLELLHSLESAIAARAAWVDLSEVASPRDAEVQRLLRDVARALEQGQRLASEAAMRDAKEAKSRFKEVIEHLQQDDTAESERAWRLSELRAQLARMHAIRHGIGLSRFRAAVCAS